ncbi:MFS transporter, partial [Rhodococcus hoagii]|nr:MFS transporter [Prescottella equi]
MSTTSLRSGTALQDAPPRTRRWAARHFHGIGYVLAILLVGANMPTALYGVYRA